MTAPVRILLADDHAVVRAGLVAMLGTEPGLVIAAQSPSADDAVQRSRLGDIDVVLMDLRFAGDGTAGVAATRKIRQLTPAPEVLILTSHDTDSDIVGAIEAGACGYLLKDSSPEELVAAIFAAHRGEGALSPAVAKALLGRVRNPVPHISDRELEVLRAVAAGSTNRQIARDLTISEATVKTHLVHIFGKLTVSSRTGAVNAARELGLL